MHIRVFSLCWFALFLIYLLPAQTPEYDTTDWKVYLFQKNSFLDINKQTDTLQISKNTFSIGVIFNRVPNSAEYWYYASASLNNLQFRKAKIGIHPDSVEYFGPGRSMAMHPDRACSFLGINDNGCCDGFHFMRYNSENSRTLDSIKFSNTLIKLEWPISEILYKNVFYPVSKFDFNTIFITLYTDLNKNLIMEENEIRNIVVEFNR